MNRKKILPNLRCAICHEDVDIQEDENTLRKEELDNIFCEECAKNLDNNKKEEIALRKDSEWNAIDSELCFVTDFKPLAGSLVVGENVISQNNKTPYASITVGCKKLENKKVIGYLTHKIDFINVWHAFEKINSDEEILIYWTTKHYNNILFRAISNISMFLFGGTPLPKIFVILSRNGTYKKYTEGRDCCLPEDKQSLAFIYGFMPKACWIPDIMREKRK